jgi:hypothetical protein
LETLALPALLWELLELSLLDWELTFYLLGQPVVPVVQLLTVQVAQSHTLQLDCCCLAVLVGVAVQRVQEVVSQPPLLRASP